MRDKLIFIGEGLFGYIIGVALYDRFVGLLFAFLAGALGYLGKIAMEKLQRYIQEKRHGK